MLFSTIIPIKAAELNSKLEAVAQELTKAAAAKNITAATLAIFPFQADATLSKKRVNFAVSEILTKDILKLGKFTIIERAQLEEVLKEQKLGLSGAVDSKMAAGIGKLAGAKFLILGNIIQTGSAYQLTAKLIDAETGEMIASEIIEVPVKIFEEDAGRYLLLVPDSQAIGLYLALGRGYTTKDLSAASTPFSTLPATDSETSLSYAGVGLRYFLSPKWMLDTAIMPEFELRSGSERAQWLTYNNLNRLTGTMLRLSVNRAIFPRPKLKTYIGAGAMLIYLKTPEESGYTWTSSYKLPFVRLGLEYKLQTRLGLSLFGQYSLRKDSVFRDNFYKHIIVKQFTFPELTFETAASLYF